MLLREICHTDNASYLDHLPRPIPTRPFPKRRLWLHNAVEAHVQLWDRLDLTTPHVKVSGDDDDDTAYADADEMHA